MNWRWLRVEAGFVEAVSVAAVIAGKEKEDVKGWTRRYIHEYVTGTSADVGGLISGCAWRLVSSSRFA